MSRTLPLLLVAALAAAAEYAPKPEQVQLYAWHVQQSAEWSSAGDRLRFDTAIDWTLALRCAAVDGPRLRLVATFLDVKASHRGPGIASEVDSKAGSGGDDPLLGHLLVLAGKSLTLDVERATGAVATVTGGEAVIAAINQRSPALVPGDPPPLDVAARAAYGPDALARLWSQVLALPGPQSAQRVALPPPFTGGAALERTWTGQAWTAAVPAGAAAPTFELAKDPTPVTGEVQGLHGKGSLTLKDGLPFAAEAHLEFTLAMRALTQPVESKHTLDWKLQAQ